MGTDIHLTAEYRFKTDAMWHPHMVNEEMFVWRDYSVFRKLVGGVREDGITVPISVEPRGLPEDCHQYTRNLLAGQDYHTHSWISWDEFKNAFPWDNDPMRMEHFALVCWSFCYGIYSSANVRFIFAFDN